MRRLLVGLCALSLVAATVGPSAARAGGKREYEAPYKTGAPGAYTDAVHGWYYDCELDIGCALIPTQKGDRRVELEVVDATGRPVRAEVYTMPGGHHYLSFCGAAEKPVPVTADMELLVHVIPGTCADGSTLSSPTTGTVKATFTTKPR